MPTACSLKCLDGRKGLVDAGCGSGKAFSDRARSFSGLGENWPLMETLAALQIEPEDIDFVILTHLHWDHAGGVTDPDGGRSFPNAELIVPQTEWDDAHAGDPLLYKAYPSQTIEPLKNYPNVRLLPPGPIFPGISFLLTGGHTRGHCAVHFQSDQLEASGNNVEQALFASDACPTRHHLRMVFHPAYDLYPMQTRAWKRDWLPRCAEENIYLYFSHDTEGPGGLIEPDEKTEFRVRDEKLELGV